MSKKSNKKQVKETKKLKLSVKRTLKFMFGDEWRKSIMYRIAFRKAHRHELRRNIKRVLRDENANANRT